VQLVALHFSQPLALLVYMSSVRTRFWIEIDVLFLAHLQLDDFSSLLAAQCNLTIHKLISLEVVVETNSFE